MGKCGGRCEKMCWGVRKSEGRSGKCVEVWGK